MYKINNLYFNKLIKYYDLCYFTCKLQILKFNKGKFIIIHILIKII